MKYKESFILVGLTCTSVTARLIFSAFKNVSYSLDDVGQQYHRNGAYIFRAEFVLEDIKPADMFTLSLPATGFNIADGTTVCTAFDVDTRKKFDWGSCTLSTSHSQVECMVPNRGVQYSQISGYMVFMAILNFKEEVAGTTVSL